jgi:hypothetical protein
MAKYYYALSSYNSKKREWRHETTMSLLSAAKKRCISESRNGDKWRIVKEEVKYVYSDGKIVNK